MRSFFLCLLAMVSTQARTFVFPHVLERAGLAAHSKSTFDTIFYATYAGARSAELQVFLYDNMGQPMRSATGGEVCSPCSLTFTPQSRSQMVRVDDKIREAGGFPMNGMQLGFAVVVTGGMDPDALALEAKLVHSLSESGDYSIVNIPAQEVEEGAAFGTKILPYFAEAEASINSTPYTFDTTILAMYVAGLAGLPFGLGATLDVYLYGAGGDPLRALNGEVCNPCSFPLNADARKVGIRVQDLIAARGGGIGDGLTPLSGFALLQTRGADPSSVAAGAFVANSHQHAFDLGISWIHPEPSSSPSTTYLLPHLIERAGKIADTQFTFDTHLFATYSGGLAGTPGGTSASIDLYLYSTGAQTPLLGGDGVPICAPCTYDLGGSTRRVAVSIEDLIARHGFARNVEIAQALVQVRGTGAAEVNVQAFVVNAHTSSRDLSILPVRPSPLGDPDAPATLERASYVVPRLLETHDRTAFTPHSLDDAVFLFYGGGLSGLPGRQVTANVYIFAGQEPLRGGNGAVCAPCSFTLDANRRYVNFNLENHLGPFSALTPLADVHAIIEAQGDVANLSVSEIGINSHSSVFDASMWASEIRPLPVRAIVPRISQITYAAGVVTISYQTEPGLTYQLESRDANGGMWTIVQELAGDGTVKTYNARTRVAPTLYRLRAQ